MTRDELKNLHPCNKSLIPFSVLFSVNSVSEFAAMFVSVSQTDDGSEHHVRCSQFHSCFSAAAAE